MLNTELFAFAQKIDEKCLATLRAKNHDYATGERKETDALQNFKLVEYLGICSAETGVMVRLCDKFSRLANTYNGGNQVKDESTDDTALDAINYLKIFLALREERRTQ